MLNNMRLLISYNKMKYVLSSAWIRNIILPNWNLQWLEQFLKGALFLKKASHNITRLYLSVILIFRSFWAQTRKRSVLGHFREGSNASSTCKLCSVLCSWVLNQRVDTPVWNMTFDPWALASWQATPWPCSQAAGEVLHRHTRAQMVSGVRRHPPTVNVSLSPKLMARSLNYL